MIEFFKIERGFNLIIWQHGQNRGDSLVRVFYESSPRTVKCGSIDSAIGSKVIGMYKPPD